METDHRATIELCRLIFETKNAKHVNVCKERIEEFSKTISESDLAPEVKDSQVNKDADEHMNKLEKAALYFAYNAVNFSFFPDRGEKRWFVVKAEDAGKGEEVEYVGVDDEAHAIVHALLSDRKNLLNDFDALQKLSESDVEEIFQPAPSAGRLPLISERTRCLNLLGKAYANLCSCPRPVSECRCQPIENLLHKSKHSAPEFVRLLCEACPIFDDSAKYEMKDDDDSTHTITIQFHKRAQLLASMLNSDSIAVFTNMDSLTVFADYRIPQLFRHLGIIKYSEYLSGLVDKQQEIKNGSPEEVEIRAATIYASELLRACLEERLKSDLDSSQTVQMTNARLDYYLWSKAVDLAENDIDTKDKIKPFHRCRCIYY
uniref:Queuosine 5'-phosphate N-glycosylase/hydrolase n=1 Tax=Aplanochytrium stocchinoi TaxID=215587 RepID=A0A7S3LKV5_9STRA|mmetsp:Transcript_30360/g.37520  ORF Transcript_30360/g.37520 Transcript_30360/m.37520 type:complete len:374 (+) Transcript_30360:425-1546(+)